VTQNTTAVSDPFANSALFYRQPPEERITRETLPAGETLWIVWRYEDVSAILKDTRFAQTRFGTLTDEERAALPPVPDFMQVLEGSDMLTSDPPVHTRLRGLVHKAFTPRLIEGMRPRIEQIAAELLDSIAARETREMELIVDFALPLPVIVIAELLGLPADDRDRFRAWTDVLTTQTSYTPENADSLAAVTMEFMAYFTALFEVRRAEPRADLITALVRAEEAGDQLSENELHAMVMLILAAGHETTVNLLANSVLMLLQHPAELARLRAHPELMPSAVEEFLRYAGPVHAGERFPKEDVPFGDVVFRRGERVMTVMASANRDPHRFHDPDRLDVGRADNKHLSFGQGIHFCLGAPLARLEGQIALDALLRRFPNLRLLDESVTMQVGMVTTGLRRLPLAF
jgi:cytochrome P450